jgi:hypothetical protein
MYRRLHSSGKGYKKINLVVELNRSVRGMGRLDWPEGLKMRNKLSFYQSHCSCISRLLVINSVTITAVIVGWAGKCYWRNEDS